MCRPRANPRGKTARTPSNPSMHPMSRTGMARESAPRDPRSDQATAARIRASLAFLLQEISFRSGTSTECHAFRSSDRQRPRGARTRRSNRRRAASSIESHSHLLPPERFGRLAGAAAPRRCALLVATNHAWPAHTEPLIQSGLGSICPRDPDISVPRAALTLLRTPTNRESHWFLSLFRLVAVYPSIAACQPNVGCSAARKSLFYNGFGVPLGTPRAQTVHPRWLSSEQPLNARRSGAAGHRSPPSPHATSTGTPRCHSRRHSIGSARRGETADDAAAAPGQEIEAQLNWRKGRSRPFRGALRVHGWRPEAA